MGERINNVRTTCGGMSVTDTSVGARLSSALAAWFEPPPMLWAADALSVTSPPPALDAPVALGIDVDALVVRLFTDEGHSLVRLARLFVDDRNAAEDLVQEAFIRLARSAHRIEDPARAPAYLRSIVLNLARDHNRRGLISLRHHGRPTSSWRPVEDELVLARGPAPGHRRAARAARSPARLRRAALLLRARHRRDRRDARHLAELREDASQARPRRAGDACSEDEPREPRRRRCCATRCADGAARRAREPRPVRAGRAEHRGRPRLVAGSGDAWRRIVGCARRRARRGPRSRSSTSRRRGAHGLVDPRAAHDRGSSSGSRCGWGRSSSASARLRGRRVPRQPAHGQELHRADRLRVLPDLLRATSCSRSTFELPSNWDTVVNGAQLKSRDLARIAGILLIIGLLHGFNLLALPVMGRLLHAQPPARRAGRTAPSVPHA